MNWEDAKQQVAENKKFPDWEFMMAAYMGIMDHVGEEKYIEMLESVYQDAIELWANRLVTEWQPENPVDYRALLVTYIAHVTFFAGESYMEARTSHPRIQLTDQERLQLQVCKMESNAKYGS